MRIRRLCDKMNKLGEYSYGGTPSYIPNLEVKPIYADGTWLEAAWESMDLPSKLLREKLVLLSLFLFLLISWKKWYNKVL